MFDSDTLENLGALHYEVLLPTCNVKKSLEELEEKDARAVRRKYRKLRRKAVRQYVAGLPRFQERKIEKSAERFLTRKLLRDKGNQLIGD